LVLGFWFLVFDPRAFPFGRVSIIERKGGSLPRIVILGAGPTGLGAAWRLHEHGYTNWTLIEAEPHAGGLASSFIDEKGYTWDVGGHVQFSHYKYFDRLMDTLLGTDGWLHHERESWVWMCGGFVPYPFQNNIRHLPKNVMWECLQGLIEVYKQGPGATPPPHFGAWFDRTFGAGIAKHFLRPYNFKVWAYPPEQLQWSWIGERVAVTDLARVTENILYEKDDLSWGPNNTFRFPKHGGTGSIWRECARRLPAEHMQYGRRVVAVDVPGKALRMSDGSVEKYDYLLSSVPLDLLAQATGNEAWSRASEGLVHSSTHVIGVGLHGKPGPHIKTKCWMYFPEADCPFYRVTVFSNYSPNNVPDITKGWSLMGEVSESPAKPVDNETVAEETVRGMIATKLIESRDQVDTVWHRRFEHGYPTPSLSRDKALDALLVPMMKQGIYSRGRFGAWKYEVSNQDHSLMQGVECIDHLLLGTEELTVWFPGAANARKPWA